MTQETKHTAVLWQVSPCLLEDENYTEFSVVAIVHGQRLVVADVTACRDFTQKKTEAHARLIAAAPELLEALKLFMDEHDNTYDGEPLSIEMFTFIEKAKTAIAKVTDAP